MGGKEIIINSRTNKRTCPAPPPYFVRNGAPTLQGLPGKDLFPCSQLLCKISCCDIYVYVYMYDVHYILQSWNTLEPWNIETLLEPWKTLGNPGNLEPWSTLEPWNPGTPWNLGTLDPQL